MLLNNAARSQSESTAGARHSLCFVVDTDFGYLKGLATTLRGLGVNTVEFVNSGRLGENVENHNPDIVFVNLNATDPHDCTRALFSLRECKFAGRVQLFGRCEPAFLESFRKIGNDASLAMLPVLQKPIDIATVRKVVQEQKLNTELVSPPDLSLKKAIASNWISFLYQPQMNLKRRMVVGAETFVRVTHPQHGVLPPARFLGGASEEDLSGLAAQAIGSAVKTSAAFFKAGAPLKFAVNINVDTLARLPVAILVEKYRPPDDQWPGLVFDVTETQVLTKTALLKSRVGGLRQAGVSLAIDNFGRGNSSFGIFKELPFAEIKIDRSCVHGCADDEGNAKVCKSMIELAHNFGSKASAVGIETSADAQKLAEFGCDNGQGYLFAKPMTEQELMAMVMSARDKPVASVG
ncbi:MAG TPA: EAL domain-containing protein [Xanthobacteraceae bacterium]|jgi:EAL domain-containing protein (putative c-di-GMP-specific phosphodiesterase class I)